MSDKNMNKVKKGILLSLLLVFLIIIYLQFNKNLRPIVSLSKDQREIEEIKVKANRTLYNLLLISVDTLRTDYIHFFGYDLESSPAIDNIFSRSLYFPNALTTIPRTTQALASLLTGCYPFKTEVRFLWDALSNKTTTLAEILKKAGYQTIAVVTNDLLPSERRLDRGFDIYDYATDIRDANGTTQAAIDHLEQIDSTKPYFLWIHYIDPHTPYYPNEDLAVAFNPEYKGRYRFNFGEKSNNKDYAYPEDIGKEQVIYHNNLGVEINQHIRRLYAADIRQTDEGIAHLLNTLSYPHEDNLLIVFTADHGESLGEHDYYYEHGDYLYNPELKVPLAFVLPNDHPYKRTGPCDEWASLIDVLPTILELLDIEVLSKHINNIDGKSLVPLIEKKLRRSRTIFAESGECFYPESIKRRVRFDISGRFRCVVHGDWKLIWTPFQSPHLQYELYNIRTDPLEIQNLYGLGNPELKKLTRYLKKWMTTHNQSGIKSIATEKDIETLKSLGYLK